MDLAGSELAGWVEWASVVSAAHSPLCWWGSTNFPLFFLILLLRFMLHTLKHPAQQACDSDSGPKDCFLWTTKTGSEWTCGPRHHWAAMALLLILLREGHRLSWQSQVWEIVGLDLLADIFATMWSLRRKPLYRRTVDRSRDLRSWWCYQAVLKTPNPWPFTCTSVSKLSFLGIGISALFATERIFHWYCNDKDTHKAKTRDSDGTKEDT